MPLRSDRERFGLEEPEEGVEEDEQAVRECFTESRPVLSLPKRSLHSDLEAFCLFSISEGLNICGLDTINGLESDLLRGLEVKRPTEPIAGVWLA